MCVFASQIVWGLDQVTLLNPPEEPLPDHRLKILYSCDEPATVRLDCIISFETGVTRSLQLRRWGCVPGGPQVSSVELNLPDWLLYRADGIVPDSQWVLSCILRASVTYGGFQHTELYVAAQDVAVLQPRPFYSRPVKVHELCVSWSTRMLQLARRSSADRCPLETGDVQTTLSDEPGDTTQLPVNSKLFISPRNDAPVVSDVCFNWRKLWCHKEPGALHQRGSGAHAC